MTQPLNTSPHRMPPPSFLAAEEILSGTFVRSAEIHDTLDSTNNRAVELASQTGIELPALIVARLQSAGRGRGANKWWSADGALTFSLLIEPAAHGISTASWPQLSLATAVAVCDAIELALAGYRPQSLLAPRPTPPAPTIKWPNDVLVDGRKVAGILLESPGGPAPAKDRLIIGVGLNVNNSWRAAPHDAGRRGTALCDASGRSFDLQSVLIAILNAVARRIEQLRSGDAQLVAAWQRLNFLAGRKIVVACDDRKFEGTCAQIAGDGALILDTSQGRQRFASGSVQTAASATDD